MQKYNYQIHGKNHNEQNTKKNIWNKLTWRNIQGEIYMEKYI